MATDVLTVSPDTRSATRATQNPRETGAAVGVEHGDHVGVIPERDLMRPMPGTYNAGALVSERMSRHVMTASSDTSVPAPSSWRRFIACDGSHLSGNRRSA